MYVRVRTILCKISKGEEAYACFPCKNVAIDLVDQDDPRREGTLDD